MTRFKNRRLVPQEPERIDVDGVMLERSRPNLTIRQAFEQSFMELGGVPALTAWARANPTEFYKIVARLLPIEVSGDPSRPLIIAIRREDEENDDTH